MQSNLFLPLINGRFKPDWGKKGRWGEKKLYRRKERLKKAAGGGHERTAEMKQDREERREVEIGEKRGKEGKVNKEDGKGRN
jgi:hypothetical protein